MELSNSKPILRNDRLVTSPNNINTKHNKHVIRTDKLIGQKALSGSNTKFSLMIHKEIYSSLKTRIVNQIFEGLPNSKNNQSYAILFEGD